jgi:hypothetical protein
MVKFLHMHQCLCFLIEDNLPKRGGIVWNTSFLILDDTQQRLILQTAPCLR